MSDGIPEGWQWSQLGDVGKWCGGGTPSKSNAAYWDDRSIPWVSPKDMQGKWICSSEDHITTEGLSNSAAQVRPVGTILLVFRSGILRHTLPIGIATTEVTVNQDMKAIVVNGTFHRDYVYQWIAAHSGHILKQCAKVGTTVESLDWQSVRDFVLVQREMEFPVLKIRDNLRLKLF